jgi:hypothetical protein
MINRAFNTNASRSERVNRSVYSTKDILNALGSHSAAFIRLANDIILDAPIALSTTYHHQIDGSNAYTLKTAVNNELPFEVGSHSGLHLSNLIIPNALSLIGTGISMLNVQDGYSDGYSDGYGNTTISQYLDNATVDCYSAASTATPWHVLQLPTIQNKKYFISALLTIANSSSINGYNIAFAAKNTAGTVSLSTVTDVYISEADPAIGYSVYAAGTSVVIAAIGPGEVKLHCDILVV